MRFRIPLAVALAALVAIPPSASAASTRRRRATRKATRVQPAARSTEPAPRAASAEPAESTASSEPQASGSALSIGGMVGAEVTDWYNGLAMRMDGELELGHPLPGLSVSAVASLGFMHMSREGSGLETSWNVVKLIPAARVTLAAAPKIGLYGDAGAGLYYGRTASKWSYPVAGGTAVSDVAFTMRFGVGCFYELNAKTRLAAEVSVGRYAGDAHETAWTVGAGAIFGM